MSVLRRPLAAAVIALAFDTALTTGAGLTEFSDSGTKLHSQGPQDSAGWG
ncbi:hypothetical protein [Streptomyces sp. ISL-100]|nr:hypothetical protein [Streptomyces sp. ISL-100]MBT2401778.1 hypothetical protein [Streptomyces sp. ISL-100]